MIRDIEMHRAKQTARVDSVICPADVAPTTGLPSDRETATAIATAEFLVRNKIDRVMSDRTLPLIFAHHIRERGITIDYSETLGVIDRRAKDQQELAWLKESQSVTERAVQMACEMIANASADDHGVLHHDGLPLTSERVRTMVDVFFLENGYADSSSIVACGVHAGDCHDRGTGTLRTSQTIIVDIFPRNTKTQYCGDCTRTVVHGDIPDEIVRMHAAVVAAKKAAIDATRAGTTGDAVYQATIDVITQHGYEVGLPKEADSPSRCAMVHGTGHGIGLDVHEPPLIDRNGPELVVGDVLTIEPGVYQPDFGGVRVEDMVAVTQTGCENFNTVPEGLEWK